MLGLDHRFRFRAVFAHEQIVKCDCSFILIFYVNVHILIQSMYFRSQVFPGVTNQNDIVRRPLMTEVKARFVRFYPLTFHSWPCLRLEIFVLK